MSTSLANRMREDGIRSKVTHLEDPPAADTETSTKGTDWWRVQLTRDGKRLTQAYGIGPGNHGSAPTGEDVLETLLLNVSGVTGSSGYRDWLSDYGLSDTPQLRRTYRRNVQLTDRMRRFLGDKFDTYLYDTER
jgi:hypothetical protein